MIKLKLLQLLGVDNSIILYGIIELSDILENSINRIQFNFKMTK